MHTQRRASGVPGLLFVAACTVAVAVGGGCSAFETNLQDTEVTYQETARQNFEAGEKAIVDGRFNEGIKFFDHVKNKYPYSKYAVLAELGIADAQFAREKWLESADAYRLFVRFHPRHEKVPWAMFRIAEAHFKDIPEDWAFLPAGREKDQTPAKDAIRACDDFLTRFPDDEKAPEAKALRTQARARLAENDLYAARFYTDREKWQGAMWRYEHVAREYGDTAQAPYALLEAATIAEEKMKSKADAQRLYEQLLREHPSADEAVRAKEALAALTGLAPAATTPAPPAADPKKPASGPEAPAPVDDEGATDEGSAADEG